MWNSELKPKKRLCILDWIKDHVCTLGVVILSRNEDDQRLNLQKRLEIMKDVLATKK